MTSIANRSGEGWQATVRKDGPASSSSSIRRTVPFGIQFRFLSHSCALPYSAGAYL